MQHSLVVVFATLSSPLLILPTESWAQLRITVRLKAVVLQTESVSRLPFTGDFHIFCSATKCETCLICITSERGRQ